MDYYQKYLKYKQKYILEKKNLKGGIGIKKYENIEYINCKQDGENNTICKEIKYMLNGHQYSDNKIYVKWTPIQ